MSINNGLNNHDISYNIDKTRDLVAGNSLVEPSCRIKIYYADKYDDDKELEYRHIMLPKDIDKLVPKTHLMSESEWRNLDVQQSQEWVHYMIHEPEPHILLFRRPLPNKPKR
ncbi:cyclin-dependent kinases regulatory subunit 1-like [Perognathus longimembris pacificus]|uniref:cyclin-dependent kinases regulatory subunit 1-like n=1 Tax=Perognathus longimembris pacificus TaxID=214514 RepID=UPI002019F70A|nr:cyclin-dependent kinases regulatory subunit 1-like [Perognathus longimembris pacificus]